MNKRELIQKTGNIAQMCGVRESYCTSGKAAGLRMLHVYNAAGIAFTVILDKCLDIFDFHYRGINCAFQTKNGLTSNQWYQALNNEFMDYWSAGMLCTCGLENVGPSCETQDGTVLPLHGRIGMTPAENVCIRQLWKDNDFCVEIEGQMRETRVEGHNLLLTRKISTSIYADSVLVEDMLENQGNAPFDYMLLYHLNFGYPIVDESTILKKGTGNVTGRTAFATQQIRNYYKMDEVQDGAEEAVFFHDVIPEQDGLSKVQLFNPKIGIGAEVSYSYDTLPVLSQWKFCAPGEYVMGIEPGNSYLDGRINAQKNNAIACINPGEQKKFVVKIRMIDVTDA